MASSLVSYAPTRRGFFLRLLGLASAGVVAGKAAVPLYQKGDVIRCRNSSAPLRSLKSIVIISDKDFRLPFQVYAYEGGFYDKGVREPFSITTTRIAVGAVANPTSI